MVAPEEYYRPRRAQELRRIASRLDRWLPPLLATCSLTVIGSTAAFIFCLPAARHRYLVWLFFLWLAAYVLLHLLAQLVDLPEECRAEADRLERDHRCRLA